MSEHKRPYTGRFAPSPTGELHLGSLVSALASYLDSRSHNGRWLIRIEDIDPPREIAGASQAIINSLNAHGLYSDAPIVYQSNRLALYHHYLKQLTPYCYPCYCTRIRMKALNGTYDGHCQGQPKQPKAFAVRLNTHYLSESKQQCAEHFIDSIKGPQYQPLQTTCGDFIIQRKDALIAYQLAVVVDDIEQQITHVIRGDDLLDSTARQRHLFLLLGKQPPEYGHIPVVLNETGQKLSKQHFAPPLDSKQAFNNLVTALGHLKIEPPNNLLETNSIDQLLLWGASKW